MSEHVFRPRRQLRPRSVSGHHQQRLRLSDKASHSKRPAQAAKAAVEADEAKALLTLPATFEVGFKGRG